MFIFYSDPGHGWLEVSAANLRALGLNPTDFSTCSYRKGNVFYLEEDCDAPKFITAWEAKNKTKFQFRENLDGGFIRDLRSIR
jgi:hypothetical protein